MSFLVKPRSFCSSMSRIILLIYKQKINTSFERSFQWWINSWKLDAYKLQFHNRCRLNHWCPNVSFQCWAKIYCLTFTPMNMDHFSQCCPWSPVYGPIHMSPVIPAGGTAGTGAGTLHSVPFQHWHGYHLFSQQQVIWYKHSENVKLYNGDGLMISHVSHRFC